MYIIETPHNTYTADSITIFDYGVKFKEEDTEYIISWHHIWTIEKD